MPSQTSNAAESETQESTARKQKRKQHCEKGTRKLSDESIQQIGICKYCKVDIPTVHASTSGLKNHLVKRCKSSPLYGGSNENESQAVLTNETMGQGNALVPHIFSQKKCELKLTRYVVIDEVSFRAVEGNGFVGLLHELQPRFRIPDRKKIAGFVYDIFLEEKAKIRSVIGEQRVSITTDTWTSIQNINYMVITAHFLDGDWKPHKKIINFTKLTSHNGEEIGKMVEVFLREWGIEKVFSVVDDYAAIDYLKRRMKSENSLLFEGKYLHMRCVCHILNLIVKDGLKELDSSIKAIRNSIIFIHSSPSRLNKFREFAVLAKFSITSTVSMDVKTRWNATYKMLEVALKYRRVFERMAEEWFPFINYFHEADEKDKKRLGPPVADDWENAKTFVHFLKKFYDATLELSASKSPTSQLIYQSLIALQVEIERKRLDDSDPTLKKVAHAMKLKFDKYWGNWDNMNHRYLLSISAGGGLCDALFDDVDAQNEEEQLLDISNEVDKYLADEIEKRSNQYSNLLEWWKGNENRYPIISMIAKDIFAIPSSTSLVNGKKNISNEVDKYLADEIEKRSNQYSNLLEWWKGNENRYPIISMIAKDIFAIPSSTVASEAAFSLGKRVVDPFRSCLSPKMVEALVCTSDWLTSLARLLLAWEKDLWILLGAV
ncbi:hypothetical protein F511_37959 [Dorcoceras hygrometricum]|uniref:BED-type domain-containing protein n=1 Tax=Dorcoceras hygrometricum TaxID=472368 RepID=A0A2Z7AGQ0_9LAMI|nr:hypothetical protein F511_37959 [Dorcoceras hygrometricum]